MKNNLLVGKNYKWDNINDWIKCHLIAILLFSIVPLIVGITIGIVLPRYQLMYPLTFIIWILAMKFFDLLVVFVIQKMINNFIRKKYIILTSVILHMIQSFLYILPLLIGIIVDVFVLYIFDIIMMICMYIYYILINFIIEFFYNKFFVKNKENNITKNNI